MNHDSSSPARAAPVTARGQATRLRILRSAETVFGHKGYDGASIAEICRLADTALGSFYVYFPDKKAAFVELIASRSREPGFAPSSPLPVSIAASIASSGRPSSSTRRSSAAITSASQRGTFAASRRRWPKGRSGSSTQRCSPMR